MSAKVPRATRREAIEGTRELVGRLAPSPTGELHLGHARSFLLAYWSMRSRGGKLILRLEDLDLARSRAEYCDAAERDLEWLGLDWDERQLQSDHLEETRGVAHELLASGAAFACTCTRGDVREALSAPHGAAGSGYPGTCRNRYASLAEAERRSGKLAGIRFRAPDRVYGVDDRVVGTFQENLARGSGDFLILRRDKLPAYQLAVVVDDARSKVTEVLRGDDLLSSTPRQLALFEALGAEPPRFAHVPLVVDEAGRRLAKRTDALSLAKLRASGVDAKAIVGWVARSVGLEAPERVAARELSAHFDLGEVPPGVVRVDEQRIAKLLQS